MVAAPRVAQGFRLCKSRVLLLDYAASTPGRNRTCNRPDISRVRYHCATSVVDSKEFASLPALCKSAMLLLHHEPAKDRTPRLFEPFVTDRPLAHRYLKRLLNRQPFKGGAARSRTEVRVSSASRFPVKLLLHTSSAGVEPAWAFALPDSSRVPYRSSQLDIDILPGRRYVRTSADIRLPESRYLPACITVSPSPVRVSQRPNPAASSPVRRRSGALSRTRLSAVGLNYMAS